VIRKTPTPEIVNEVLSEKPLHLKTYRLDSSEIAAIQQGLSAVEFLIELFKARGDTERADTLACHAYNLTGMLRDLDSLPAVTNDMGYN
jgi:hypothetical protein